ncbi:NAD(P)-dependent oxidoreductase [Nocardioides bizhenqiangii]|uniref:NAD(P)-binding oxidoreductase n=1 Tax=Nocardioides bizhenqiangii TaxID=3095076 RepID=A0ABZ0ZRI3_9ACTN|nr:NAD(P)-binding oxidoreductase [Nocardioides sp. HM61]WQQ26900.1 NAD(P)-binding oxidoreductase [Nocardioides sp. HM61]
MKILVVGGSRGTGAAVVRTLAADGHLVTAFARSASSAGLGEHGVVAFDGDVMDADDLGKAMIGQDAVVVTLGISDNPLKVQYLRRASTPLDIRSAGTRRVVEAMQSAGLRRLVVQTVYGLGEGRRHLDLKWKLIFGLLLRPQIRDSTVQEQVVRESGLDWTLVRPVALTDEETTAPAHVDAQDERLGLQVARAQVARVFADVVDEPTSVGKTLSVSS